MLKKLKTIVIPNLPLKLLSFVGGYLLWSVMAQSHMVTVKRTVPVCMYNTPKEHNVTAPETIEITVQAHRHQLYTLDLHELAVHVDAARLHSGTNQLHVNRSTLFLPEGINVVHYTPSNAVITVN